MSMIVNNCIQLISKSRLLYVLSIIVTVILTGTTTTKCFSNQFVKMDNEENCGPTGFCFIMRKHESSIRQGYYTVRGCDHTFLCELISETKGVNKVEFTKGEINYCMHNVQYMNYSGYFCCCNNDWCNKFSIAEEVREERILKDLIQGAATEEKWQKLQEITKKYEIGTIN